MLQHVKRGVNAFLSPLGLEMRRKVTQPTTPRASLVGSLQHAREVGFLPASIIDVGAAYGWFSLECHEVFSQATYVLLEPLFEYQSFLQAATGRLISGRYVQAAAASDSGSITINVHPDLVGSSLLREGGDEATNGLPRRVPAVTLDELVVSAQLQPPFLVKLDIQGAELEALRGGTRLLEQTEWLMMEVSLFAFFESGPQFCEIVAFMKSRGFVAYDVLGMSYRPLDGALAQVDLVFVKENGAFRRHHQFADEIQRITQNKYFQRMHGEKLAEIAEV